MVRSLRFSPSRYLSILVAAGETLKTINTSAPRLKILVATYPLMPLTKVTTAITAATPITTPSSVSTERSLFAHSDRNAILIASEIFMGQVAGVGCQHSGIEQSLSPRVAISLTAQSRTSATRISLVTSLKTHKSSVLCGRSPDPSREAAQQESPARKRREARRRTGVP